MENEDDVPEMTISAAAPPSHDDSVWPTFANDLEKAQCEESDDATSSEIESDDDGCVIGVF